MSKEPLYGYAPCCHPGCEGRMALHIDPADFSFSKLCRSCRVKRQTHVYVAFCEHGNPVTNLGTMYPLAKSPAPPCGCGDEDLSGATWDWVLR